MTRSPRAGRSRAPTAAPAATAPPAAAWLELPAVALVWLGFARLATHGVPSLAFDAFRDMAYAHGIARGEPWRDPTLAGLAAWYPPGLPALFALVSRLTGMGVPRLYATSIAWLGWTFPVTLFGLVRSAWGRACAWLALPFVLVGSRWWLLHAAMPMSSVQSVALALATLWTWQRFGRHSARGAAATGALAAATLWCHVLCGALAIGAVVLHAAGAWIAARRDPTLRGGAAALGRRAGGAALVAAAFGAPPPLAQLVLPRLNPAPHHWFGPELHDPRFFLHARAPLAPLLGVAGLVLVSRRWREHGWLPAYALLGLAGQGLGYLGHDAGWHVPWVLPHEFQWHEQLALMIAAAIATVRLGARAARGRGGRALATALIALAALGPALPTLADAGSYLLKIELNWRPLIRMSDWIARSTPEQCVVVTGPSAGYYVAGLTGRRAIALPPGHMNPAVDPVARLADLQRLLGTADEREFDSLASRYHADYLLVSVDLAPYRVLRARYDRWPSLAFAHAEDSAAVLYRIVRH